MLLLDPVTKPKERPILFQGAMVRALLRTVDAKTQTRRVAKFEADPGLNLRFTGLSASRFGESWCLLSRGEGGAWQERSKPLRCPYGTEGDRLWVRETYYAFGRWETRFSAKKCRDEWHFLDMTLECGKAYAYAADGPPHDFKKGNQRGSVTPAWWRRPAIFMPRAACRLVLENDEIHVERLQDIREHDAIAEGCITEEIVSGYDGSTIKVPAEIPHPSGIGAQGWDTATEWYAYLWESINGEGSWDANPYVWAVSFRRLTP